MLETAINIQELDTATASEAEWRAINAFRSVILGENYPDDPPPPLEQSIASLRDTPPFVGKALWTVWGGPGPEIVAGGLLNWLRTEENQHAAQFTIEVLPAWR